MKNSQRGFAPVVMILIIVIAIAGVVGYVYYNKDKTVNTNTQTTETSSDEKLVAAARLFCQNQTAVLYDANNPIHLSLQTSFVINADSDADKEIVGVCNGGADVKYDSPVTLFVLDDATKNNVELYKKSDQNAQRYYAFDDLSVEDVDKDGIDEVFYKTYGWSNGGAESIVYIYSPSRKQLSYIVEDTDASIDPDNYNREVSFSENINKLPPSFKQALQKRFDSWKNRPFSNE